MENSIKKSEVKRGRFNIVDALFILIVLALCFAVLYVVDPFNWFSVSEVKEVTLRYVVEIKDVRDDVKSNIKVGDAVFNSQTSNSLGKITSLKAQAAYTWEYEEGSTEMVKKPTAGKSDIFVTAEVKCTYEKGVGYTVNGQQIAVGMPLSLRTPGFVSNGYIITIEEVR